jgi:hypothetical protein
MENLPRHLIAVDLRLAWAGFLMLLGAIAFAIARRRPQKRGASQPGGVDSDRDRS